MQPNTQAANCRKANCSNSLQAFHAFFLAIGCFRLALIVVAIQIVGRPANSATATAQDVGVDHGRVDVLVPQ